MAYNGMTPQMMRGAAGGMIGAGLGNMFADYTNPTEAANPYFDQIPGTLEKYLSPYINAGSAALPGLNNQYDKLISDPASRLNEIGSSYHQSPGFQFALEKALQGANHAAAAGGMAGSPQHEFQNMQTATHLADQDYNQFLGNALGLYGSGLQGKQGLYNTGATAGVGMGEDLSSYLANRAKLAYEGANADNQHEGGIWGSLLSGAGTLLSFL